MSEPIRNSNDDTGRFMRTLVAWEDEGNAEFDREHQITPHGDKFCVAGVVVVDTREEAEALLSEAA